MITSRVTPQIRISDLNKLLVGKRNCRRATAPLACYDGDKNNTIIVVIQMLIAITLITTTIIIMTAMMKISSDYLLYHYYLFNIK